jgi:hypothetical protein
MFENKKLLLLSASTGALGGAFVMASAVQRFPRHGANIIGTFSLPNFSQNFDDNEGITDAVLRVKFQELIDSVNLIM